jgi:hypothetical protein
MILIEGRDVAQIERLKRDASGNEFHRGPESRSVVRLLTQASGKAEYVHRFSHCLSFHPFQELTVKDS